MSANRTPEEEAGDVIRRLRRDLARRAASSSVPDSGTESGKEFLALPRWRPEQTGLPDKQAYVLHDLLQFDDEQFVEVAYQVILRRAPDDVGFQHYCQQLRVGGVSKVEILGNLRWSQEGLQRGVHVDGLLLPYKVQQWRHRRWVGPVLEWGYTLLRLPRLARLQAISSARGAREARRIGQLLNQVSDGVGNQADAVDHRLAVLSVELQGLEQRARALSGEQATRIDKLDQLLALEFGQGPDEPAPSRVTLASRVVKLERLVEEAGRHVESHVQPQLDAAAAAIAAATERQERAELRQSALGDSYAEFRETAGVLSRRVDERLDAIEHACTHLAERISQLADSLMPALPAQGRNLDALYAAFEEDFRGSDSLIKSRVAPYIADIAAAATPGELIVDVGCGRGEWLELLRDAGYRARGIDSNEVFVQTCRSKGLDIVHGDAFEVLRQLPDMSAAGITSMHLVEHLPFPALIDLLDEAYRVLRPGGILILETPNPENLLVGANWFYMDPTHRNPLPPGLLFWLARARGFTDLRVERLTEARDVPMPDPLPEDAIGAPALNGVLEHFRAAVDYAVLARRGV